MMTTSMNKDNTLGKHFSWGDGNPDPVSALICSAIDVLAAGIKLEQNENTVYTGPGSSDPFVLVCDEPVLKDEIARYVDERVRTWRLNREQA